MYRVLYVDDEPALLEIGRMFLEMHGTLQVETATSAAEAIEKLRATPYECIISDYQMPEMDGISFLKVIRANDNRIPFILFTGRGREEVVIEAFANDADFYLQKGGDPTAQFVELEHKVLLAIESRRTQADLQESRQRMADIIDHLPDATFAINLDGRVITWNRAIEEMTGVKKETILGTTDKSYALPFYGEKRPLLLDLILIPDETIEKKYPHITRSDHKLISEIFIPLLYGGKGAYLWFIASPLYDPRGKVIGAIESIRDITDRRKAQDALAASEERYRAVVEDQTEFISRFLPDGTHVFVNEAYCRYFGKTQEEIIGTRFLPVMSAEEQALVRKHLAGLTPEHPEAMLEHRIVMQNGEIRWQQWSDRAIFDTNGQVLEFQSVGRDITSRKNAEDQLRNAYEQMTATEEELRSQFEELKQKEDELRASEQKLQGIVQGSPIPQFVIDRDHKVISWNRALEEYSGIKASEVIGTPDAWRAFYDRKRPVLSDLILNDGSEIVDKWYPGKFNRSRYVEGAFEATDFFPRMGSGGKWLYFTASAIRDVNGRYIGAVETLEDITAVKEQEAELRAGEEKYRAILENMQDVYYRSDTQGNLILASPSWARLLGYASVEELYGKNIAERFYLNPADRVRFLATIEANGSVTNYEVTLKKSDGTPVIVATNSHKYYADDSCFLGIEGTLRDITDRKHAEDELRAAYEQISATEEELRSQFDELKQKEEELRASEQKLQGIVQGSPIPQFVIDRDHKVISWNRALEEYSGIKADEVLGTMDSWRAFYDKERPVLADFVIDGDVINRPEWAEGRFRTSKYVDGAIEATDFFEHMMTGGRWLYFTASAIRDPEGNTVGAVETLEDITERRRAEEALRESGEKYRSILDNVQDVYYRSDVNGNLILATPSVLNFLGYDSLEELYGRNIADTFYANPGDREKFLNAIQSTGSVNNYVTDLRKRDGSILRISTNSHYYYDAAGKVAGIEGTIRDITELQRAEDTMNRYTLQMADIIENLPDPTFAIDTQGRVVAWNRAVAEMTGVRREEILRKGNHEYSLPFYGVRRPLLIDMVFSGDQELANSDYEDIRRIGPALEAAAPYPSLNGEQKVIRAIVSPIINSHGERIGAIESLTDITNLRSAQEALQRNEERYRTLFENTGAATVLLDENTIISLANAEFVRLSGFSRDELEGKKRWTEFVVPEDLERMLAQHRMRRVKKQAALQHYEFRFRTRSGEIRHISLTIDVIPGTTKSVASLMDVTENIRSQEALSRANRKLNLMSSITRHDVLNQLTSLFGFLQLVERRVTDPEVKQFLVREKQAAESIRAQIEFTRDYQDIGGQSPEWQRVQETLRKAAEMIPLKEIVLTTDVPMVEIYADHLLVKVFYTLVENAIRHGEHVTKIRIFSEQSDNELRIIFEDDGVGVPEDAKQMIFQRKYFQNTGLGLFLSQEILSITGLSITETGISSQGARFVIHVPRGAFRITDSQNHTV